MMNRNKTRKNQITNNNSGNGGSGYNRHNFQRNRSNNFQHRQKTFIPHAVFDLLQTESFFPKFKSTPVHDDKNLNDAIIKRNQDLTPTPNEQTCLLNLLGQVQSVLDNLVLSPGDLEACQIDEIKQVGSFKKGTMLMKPKLIADLCVVLRTLPTREAVNQLANKVLEDIQKISSVQLILNEKGFEILLPKTNELSTDVAIQCLVTTLQQNIRKLDQNLHLDSKICYQSLMSIKHARWFEENASNTTIKALVRILKDLRKRVENLNPLNPWIIDILAHHAVTFNNKREQLSLVVAFRRVFQLLASGFFLPGSAGIIDPCEANLTRVHTTMTLQDQDQVCNTFQTLLRVLLHGGYKQVLGIEGNSSILTLPSVWQNVVVTPNPIVYEPNKETDLMLTNTVTNDVNNQSEDNFEDTNLDQYSNSKIIPLMESI